MSKLRDAVYGFAVGDALGVPYEFKEKGTFTCTGMTGYGTWDQPPGTWSDDTSMLLATCDSLKHCRRVDPVDIMERFWKWARRGEYTAHGEVFDIGRTTAQALDRYDRGLPIEECGGKAINDNGNGSLMRILPLAFVQRDGRTVKDVSALTHAHPLSVTCCEVYVQYATHFIHEKEGWMGEEITSTGYVVDTLRAAFHCLNTTDNYKDCVLKAVNLGGDTDTVAACAGGLAGLRYGYDAIPKEWIEQLANKELIESCLF